MDVLRSMFAPDGDEKRGPGSSKKKEMGELGALVEQLEKMAAELGPQGPQEVSTARPRARRLLSWLHSRVPFPAARRAAFCPTCHVCGC
jgi:hypothetical protein